jgi:hypothetical protein
MPWVMLGLAAVIVYAVVRAQWNKGNLQFSRVRKAGEGSMLVVWALGMIVGGLVLVVVGTLLKNHFQTAAAICNTFGGPAGQCATGSTAFTVGQVLQPVGGIMIGLGVIGGASLAIIAKTSTGTEDLDPISRTSSSIAGSGRTPQGPSAERATTSPTSAPSASASALPAEGGSQPRRAGWQAIGPIGEGRAEE